MLPDNLCCQRCLLLDKQRAGRSQIYIPSSANYGRTALSRKTLTETDTNQRKQHNLIFRIRPVILCPYTGFRLGKWREITLRYFTMST